MNEWLLLIVALAILLLAAAGLLLWRRFRYPAEPPPPEPPAGPRDATTITNLLIERAAPQPERLPWYRRIGRLPLWQTALLTLLVLLLAAGSLFALNLSADTRYERLLVIVTPFQDGNDGRTGRNVAAALVDLLGREAGQQLEARLIESRPADAAAALQLANTYEADLLIWGEVEQGAILDSPSMRPRLIYTPRGPLTANSWESYNGRFAIPRSFTIASRPINGHAVLPPLLQAIAEYNRQSADPAFRLLTDLIENYPLEAPLPRALRGNILWARGIYDQAAAEYRLALEQPGDDQAFLANNLGAILLDAGDPTALSAFAEAVRLLDGRDLGALRYNLGLQALAADEYAEAASNLEQARNLLPASTDLLLALAEAYREQGRLEQAAATLTAAEEQMVLDQQLITPAYRDLVAQRNQAALRTQQALLGFARQVQAGSHLEWWLETAPPQPANRISPLRDQMRSAITGAERAIAGWRQRSAAESAAAADGGLISHGQAERAELQHQRQQYYLALLQIELDRSRLNQDLSGPGQFFGAIFSAAGTPMGESIALLKDLNDRFPNRPPLLAAYGRALRLAADTAQAGQRYDQVVSLTPQRPEGYYGKGLLALAADAAAARTAFNQALAADAAFFPARIQLAALDERSGDLNAAIVHYRELYAGQPGPDTAVNLARALRTSGSGGYEEAEITLLPYSKTSSTVLLELGYLYTAAQRPSAARIAFEDAIRLEPGSAEANFELGQILLVDGDLTGAEARFRATINSDPRHLQARQALAQLYQGPLNRPRDAVDQYRAMLRIGVENPDLSLAIGDVLRESDAPQYALEAYTQAAAGRPDDPAIHLRLATTHLALNQLEAARGSAQRVLELTPDPNNAEQVRLRSEALVVRGDVERRAGQLQPGIEFYNQALVLSPQSAAAVLGLGQTAVAQGNWGVALGYFERAAALPEGANDATIQFWLGEALLRNNSLQRAGAAYTQALALRPVFPEALLGLAQARQANGDLAGAEQAIDQALALRPTYAEGLLFKGKLQQEQGLIDQAIASYDASIRANSRIAETFYRRGVLFIRKNQYSRAINDLRRATELETGFGEAFYWLGRAYYATDNNQNALAAFKRAVTLQPAYTEARFYQGLVEEALGQRDAAAASYQAVIAADGSGQWGARSKAQLDKLQ